MRNLNDLFQELGISKVKLAKYLGVSRQMVYNYLELDDINKWPKEKKLLVFKLLNISNIEEIQNINITTDYLIFVENQLNQYSKNSNDIDSKIDFKGLDKESQNLLNDLIFLLKEKLSDEDKIPSIKKENYYAILYLYNLMQSIDNIPEIKYIFGYMSKTTGFTNPDEYKFHEEKQFIFESILYTALNLYYNGGASRSRLVDSHKRWIQDIMQKKEEQLSRTDQLITTKIQALRELGYSKITEENSAEVLEKIVEIESRRAA